MATAVALPLAALAKLDATSGADRLQVALAGAGLLAIIAAIYLTVDHWRKSALHTASEERRRLARDLHDGLSQELFFIVAKTASLARKDAFPGAVQLRDAAARALSETRQIIATLNADHRERLDVAIAREAEELAGRFQVGLDMEMQQGLHTSDEGHAALLRILRGAVTNSVRHGQASTVKIRLARDDRLRLSVTDDGEGFDTDAVNGEGIGLVSMRERVRSLGGELRVDSGVGRGTVIEAALP